MLVLSKVLAARLPILLISFFRPSYLFEDTLVFLGSLEQNATPEMLGDPLAIADLFWLFQALKE